MHMNITSTVLSLPVMPRKGLFKTLIGSLNSSIISYTRGHIRQSRYENISNNNESPTIDAFNEAMADIHEQTADRAALEDMGLSVTMPNIEIARKLDVLRLWAISELAALANHPGDIPLTVRDTIAFQTKTTPDINEPALKALAIALNQDFEVLKAAKLKIVQDERDELISMAGQIIDVVYSLNSFDDDDHVDSAQADDALSALPPHIQYKLGVSVLRGLKKGGDKALASLLRYNRLESAGDIALIKGAHNELVDTMKKFMEQYIEELTTYQERGGQLAEISLMI